MSKITVAGAQIAPVFLDTRATVQKVCGHIAEAGRAGAQLVVFPETLIPTYPYWNLVIDPFTSRKTYFNRLFHEAIELGDQAVEDMCAAARKSKCVVVVGLSERDGGTLYNSQLVIDADGTVLGCRRKLVPTHHERMSWGRGDGTDLTVFDSNVGKLGALICFEHSNPLYRYAVQAQGEQIHVANWPGGMPWIDHYIDAAVRHYAFEAQCFVISTTSVLTEELLDAMGEAASSKLQPGGGVTCIVGANGKILKQADPLAEEIVYAELDFEDIVSAKQFVDSSGHYARPDVVQLHLNQNRPEPLVINSRLEVG